ncbi:hypothetical protein JCM3770_005258 [Rhodotorula araucariae]
MLAHELGLASRLELDYSVKAFPTATSTAHSHLVPHGKIPALVVRSAASDAEMVLFGSENICAYLDELAGGKALPPHGGLARFEVLTTEALASAIKDAALALRYERVERPKELVWQDWVTGQLSKVTRSIPVLAKRNLPDPAADVLGLDGIAAAVALWYVDRRAADSNWRELEGGKELNAVHFLVLGIFERSLTWQHTQWYERPTFQRVVRRNGLLDLEHPYLERRQLPPLVSSALDPGGDSTTTAAPTTTTTSSAPPTTIATPPPTTTSSAPSTTPTSDEPSTSSTTTLAPPPSTSSDVTTTTSRGRTSSSSSIPADTTVTSILTPTTVIVVGTSTITSTLDPVTSTGTRSLSPSEAASAGATAGSGGLSTGAKVGIGVGAGVGGLIALGLLAFLCLGVGRKRREKRDAADNILWPATGDSAALYPEPVHNTGRAGFGVGDEGDEGDEGATGSAGHGMAEVAGAGAAGVGAAGVLGRFGSQSTTGRQPTLPAVPPSVYTTDHGAGYGGGYYDSSTPEAASAYTAYSSNGQTPSQQSHTPLTLGPASVGYVASNERHTPSPPRTGSASHDGHAPFDGPGASQSGHLPFPGEPEPQLPERTLSPRPMQVGDTFGQGYDETEGGRRWRLSVVNDDPRDRD